MAISVSSDKILSTVNPKTDSSNQKNTGETAGTAQEASSRTAPEVKPQTDDTLDVNRANELYNSSTRDPAKHNDNVSTLEQATKLTARIRDQLTENGVLALQAHTNVVPTQVGTLLSAAP